ncbi:MAG: hypothetical protein GDA46_00510 [Bdellovibrionales bacterium]|nr:hypothetical protein [Bdellovibrionales bacterium]
MSLNKKIKSLLFLSLFLFIFAFYIFKQNTLPFFSKDKKITSKCWNEINFKKTKELLLKSPIKSKIPFYEYYKQEQLSKGKTSQEIDKEYFYKTRKSYHYTRNEMFVLFYDNGLKAIFRGIRKNFSKPYNLSKNASAYKISEFLNMKIVPPTVLREVDGKKGTVQLFVENIKYLREDLKNLSLNQKNNLYLFLFLTGQTDLHHKNILISKKCFLPFFVDQDGLSPQTQVQWGEIPFHYYPIKENYVKFDKKYYNSVPFEEAQILKNPSLEVLKKTFSGLSLYHINQLEKNINDYKLGSISFFNYKNSYFIQEPRDIYKHLLPPSPVKTYSKKMIKKLEQIDEKILKDLVVGYLKQDQAFINGFLHRRDLFLKELKM